MTQAQMAPDFTLEDTRGNQVSLASRRDHVVVLIFANQATQEASNAAGKHLGARLLDYPGVNLWTIVTVPKMFKAMATGILKQTQEKIWDSGRRRFEKKGENAPADLNERILLLADWSGTLVERYGFDPKAKHVHVAVIGPDGTVLDRLSSGDGEKAANAAADKAEEVLKK